MRKELEPLENGVPVRRADRGQQVGEAVPARLLHAGGQAGAFGGQSNSLDSGVLVGRRGDLDVSLLGELLNEPTCVALVDAESARENRLVHANAAGVTQDHERVRMRRVKRLPARRRRLVQESELPYELLDERSESGGVLGAGRLAAHEDSVDEDRCDRNDL